MKLDLAMIVTLLLLTEVDGGRAPIDRRAECLAMVSDAGLVADFVEANWLRLEVNEFKRRGITKGFQLAVRGAKGWVVRTTPSEGEPNVIIVETTRAVAVPGVLPHDLRIDLTLLSPKNCCHVDHLLVACTVDRGAVQVIDD